MGVPTLLFLLLAGEPAAAKPPAMELQAGGVQPGPLKLAADQLNYYYEQGKIELSGHVSVELGKLRLRCKKVQVVLGKGERPQQVTASGDVSVSVGELSATAPRGRLAVDRRVVELTGGARLSLRQRGLRVRGRAILLDLESGKFTVDQARAKLDLRRANAR
jgi:lipopolysaccharide transport protein LptA